MYITLSLVGGLYVMTLVVPAQTRFSCPAYSAPVRCHWATGSSSDSFRPAKVSEYSRTIQTQYNTIQGVLYCGLLLHRAHSDRCCCSDSKHNEHSMVTSPLIDCCSPTLKIDTILLQFPQAALLQLLCGKTGRSCCNQAHDKALHVNTYLMRLWAIELSKVS